MCIQCGSADQGRRGPFFAGICDTRGAVLHLCSRGSAASSQGSGGGTSAAAEARSCKEIVLGKLTGRVTGRPMQDLIGAGGGVRLPCIYEASGGQIKVAWDVKREYQLSAPFRDLFPPFSRKELSAYVGNVSDAIDVADSLHISRMLGRDGRVQFPNVRLSTILIDTTPRDLAGPIARIQRMNASTAVVLENAGILEAMRLWREGTGAIGTASGTVRVLEATCFAQRSLLSQCRHKFTLPSSSVSDLIQA